MTGGMKGTMDSKAYWMLTLTLLPGALSGVQVVVTVIALVSMPGAMVFTKLVTAAESTARPLSPPRTMAQRTASPGRIGQEVIGRKHPATLHNANQQEEKEQDDEGRLHDGDALFAVLR